MSQRFETGSVATEAGSITAGWEGFTATPPQPSVECRTDTPDSTHGSGSVQTRADSTGLAALQVGSWGNSLYLDPDGDVPSDGSGRSAADRLERLQQLKANFDAWSSQQRLSAEASSAIDSEQRYVVITASREDMARILDGTSGFPAAGLGYHD